MATVCPTRDSFLYDQVGQLVVDMIDKQTLQPGDRVPSLRKMSRQLKVSVTTVMQAYVTLEEQGLIEARPQSGYFVRSRRRLEPQVPRKTRPRSEPRPVAVGDTVATILSATKQRGVMPLGIANPSTELLPVKAMNRALARVSADQSQASIDYCFPPGHEELRRQIAFRTIDLGCNIGPDDVVIANGCTEALSLALSAVAKPGDVIAVESPAYFFILEMIERLGMLALEICTDAETGMCLDTLERELGRHDVRAVVTVANFHNPVGSLMPDASKQRLVAMLAEREIPLIEDDIFGDLHFGDERPRIAKCYDHDGLVLTCSSFSKTLAPGYRIGWVIPGRFTEAVLKHKRTMGFSATPTQLAVAEFLRNGGYDRHLRRLRSAYRDQVQRMRYHVGQVFPEGTRITRPQGGFVLWVELPPGVDSLELYEQALAQGVSIAPGTLFSPTQKYRRFIRLNAGMVWSDAVRDAVDTLGELVHALAARG
jgi:DNA-binding transcriptional MocR family regulator